MPSDGQKKPLPEGAVKQTVRRRQARKRPALESLADETKRVLVDTDTTDGRYRKGALNAAPTLRMTRNHAPWRTLSLRRSLLD